MSPGRRVSWSNVFVGLALVLWGATCAGCASAPQGYGVQTVTLKLVNAQPLVPGPFEYGIWNEVEDCLEQRADITAIRLAVADSIIDMDGHQLLWGVYATIDFPYGSAATVVVDRAARYSSRVWSHEFVHVIAGVPDGDWRLDACQLRDGPHSLPVRPLPISTGEV